MVERVGLIRIAYGRSSPLRGTLHASYPLRGLVARLLRRLPANWRLRRCVGRTGFEFLNSLGINEKGPGWGLPHFGGEGGIDSNRLRAILTPSGRTACVQNATAFCRTHGHPTDHAAFRKIRV